MLLRLFWIHVGALIPVSGKRGVVAAGEEAVDVGLGVPVFVAVA